MAEAESEHWENIIAVVIVIAVVGIAWYGVTHVGTEEIVDDIRYPVTMNDDPLLGDVNAPVTIIEFSDFQCEHCADFAINTFPQLQQYIDDGSVRFVFRDFPIETIHPDAQFIHEAAGCADDQNMFWEYHDLLFENQARLTPTVLGELADELGFNRTQFDACREERKYFDEIGHDILDGTRNSVTGTPTFFINGLKLVGAESAESFKELIEKELE